jgi:hypothetical protein
MTHKKILLVNLVILCFVTVTAGSMILTADNSLARGRDDGGFSSEGVGCVTRGCGDFGSVHQHSETLAAIAHRQGDRSTFRQAVEDRRNYRIDFADTSLPQSDNRQSAVIGSIHHADDNFRANQAPALMTMSFRQGDGVRLSAKVKEDIEALRESNLQINLRDKQQEFDDFMENNWHNWKNNWDGYYGGITSSTYVGSTVVSLPEKHEVMKIRGITYYYADGVYYASFEKIYVVVPPPDGALIETIPPDLSTVTVNGTEYYNYGGVFYLKVDSGYQVIAPPTGGIVTKLPGKAYSTLINDDLYYVYGNAYYKRFFSGHSVIYKIVKAPAVKKKF